MSALSNILDRAVAANTIMGVTRAVRARQAAVELMRASETATDEARYFAAAKGILDRTTRTMRRIARGGGVSQGSFFNLHERYAVDGEAKIIKDTDRLSRLEWRAILNLRKKQITDDTAHYRAMQYADGQLSPIWDEFPDKTLGEVEAIYLRRRAAA